MGCFPDKKQDKFQPTKENEKKIKKIFKNLKEMHEESETENFVTLEALQVHFIENPYFAKLLYNFMGAQSFNSKVYKKHYLSVVETLMADSHLRPLQQFSPFSKLEVFSLIVLGEVNPDKKLQERWKINYEQTTNIIELILRMFLINAENYNPNLIESLKTLSMSLVDYYFERNGTRLNTISWKEFIISLQSKFQFIDYLLNSYYSAKFFNQQLKINLPEINESEAKLLQPDTLKLFILVNKMFSKTNKMEQLYYAKEKDFDFELLFKSLKDYNGPTLLLFSHTAETQNKCLEQTETKPEVFGAFMSSLIYFLNKCFSNKYNGNNQNKCKEIIILFFLDILQKQNYQLNPRPCYLYHNKKNKGSEGSGLGFGLNFLTLFLFNSGSEQNKQKEFKLWIDESLKLSYCKDSDSMFEDGNLISSENLNIQKVEVWGLNVSQTHELFSLVEMDEQTNVSQIKLSSDKEKVKLEVSPITYETNNEIIPQPLKATPNIEQEDEQNEFRPKSSIFKSANKIQSTAPRDLSTKKIINQLLEENSYRLAKSQLTERSNNDQVLYVSEIVPPPNATQTFMSK